MDVPLCLRYRLLVRSDTNSLKYFTAVLFHINFMTWWNLDSVTYGINRYHTLECKSTV